MSKGMAMGTALAALLLGVALIFDFTRVASKPAAPAADISGLDMKGQRWSLAEHRGKRPVVVNFFATWCAPCRQEYPRLVEMQRKYGGRGLQVVLLTQEPKADLAPYTMLQKSPLTILTDAGPAFDAYQVSAIPHTLFFDASGKLAERLEGLDEAGLDRIEKQLQ